MPTLPKSVARALPFIESAVAAGTSANVLQNSLAAAGIGVRRQDLLAAIRDIKGAQAAADRLKFIRSDFRPQPSNLPHAVTRQLRDYSFRVRVTGTNLMSGQTEIRTFNVSTNDLLSRDEIESIAVGYSTNEEEYLPFEPSEVNLISATRR